MKGTAIQLIMAVCLIESAFAKKMRNHRPERVSRKPFHCLSMRQKQRIRQEIRLIQESVAAELKKNQISKENANSVTKGGIASDRIITQQAVDDAPPENVVLDQNQQQMDNHVPQFVQQPSNSFSTTQEITLPSTTISPSFTCPMNFLPGPSGYQGAAPTENGLSPTFKTEPLTGNNQEMENVANHQNTFNYQDHNPDVLLELRKLNAKLDTFNNHLNTINARLETIERHVKQEKRKGQAPSKPSIIPMQTVQEVIDFDNASDEVFNELVQYLKYIGGFTLREALNLCMKEVLTNDVANNFTWHGKDTGHAQVGLALYSRQITNAFYEFTIGQGLQNTPINYKGFVRLFCPADKYMEEQPKNRVDTSMRLTLLRAEMSRITTIEGPPLDAYIVTSDDEHQSGRYVANFRETVIERIQSETVHEHDRRREYITGFQGSSGDALITMNKAVLWTDGRYHLQADEQLDCKWTIMKEGREDVPTITQWLINEFNGRRARVGADPKLIPAFRWKLWEKQFANTSMSLVPVRENLIDNIWKVGRKEYSSLAAFVLDDKYSGKPWQEKIKQVRLEMELSSADALIITALDEIAWLFNIRGFDLPYTPVLRAYTIITYGAIHLYAPRNKLKRSTETHLKMDACFHADCVKWHNYTSFWYDISTMSQAWNTVWLPAPCGYTQGVSAEILFSIPKGKHLVKPSPVIHLRAEKNEVEAKGMRNSHIRDAIAMCDFMSYIEEQMDYDTEGWDEKQVVRAVNEFRLEQNLSRGLSFPTIAGYGPNAALPHYEPSNVCRRIGTDSTLVIDSGGQYDDGTTDVTRTLHFGIPSPEQKDAYTRVLIGNIQLSSLIFPDDLRTDQIDVLAREALWKKGEDYMHGSSHGIGHFLSVHEPPISISYLGGSANPSECNNIRLKPGYFLSIEPGYYKDFDFGVRLENIVEVVLADKPKQWGKNFFKFREVTLVPYEPKLINVEMLTPAHRRWLNQYNRRIREEVGRELKLHLKVRAFNWLEKKTRVIPERGPVNMDFFLASHSNSLIRENTYQILFSIFILHYFSRSMFFISR